MSIFKNGTSKLFYIYINGDYLPVGCLTSNGLSESSEMLPTTTRQNAGGWATSIPTRQSYTISIAGLITTTDGDGQILTYRDLQNFKRQRIQFNWKINTEVTGYSEFGIGYITSLSDEANVDENISFSGEITGQGEPIIQLDTQEALNYTLNVTI